MKRNLLFLLLVLLVLLTSCVSKKAAVAIKYPKKVLLASDELQRWQSFKMEGIAEVQFKMFTFRKNFVLSKNKEALRFDLLDSGIFGFASSNISIYVDSDTQVYGYLGKKFIEIDDLPESLRDVYTWFNNADIDDFQPYYDDLFENNSFDKDGTSFAFTNKMRLKEINNASNDLRVNIDYDYGDNISNLAIMLKNVKICDLKIDKISYNNINVIKP
ncbi:MAG TPA: hypothetical protein PKZ69_05595 [Candidatus Cloacimonadota bacterium]|nr:hypothetical protein [Candidatus Cloacimonadota bacterium]